MEHSIRIGIIGDFNPLFEPHRIANTLLKRAEKQLDTAINFEWLPTSLFENSANADRIIVMYDAFWCSPGSPYVSLKGVLTAIKKIRRTDIPLLGTCAGCQHMMLEFIQNVVGEKNAISDQYLENRVTVITKYPAEEKLSVISRIACPIAGSRLEVKIKPGTLAHQFYGTELALEKYYCTFGLLPEFNKRIEDAGAVISGTDDSGEVRIFEVPSQRFYVATLFVPQVEDEIHLILKNFLLSAMKLQCQKAARISR